MNGYGILVVSLVIAALGIGLYRSGQMLDRWHLALQDEMDRLMGRRQRL